MAKPPSDVPADELWLKLSEPKPSMEFDFPRFDDDGKPIGKCRIQVLRQDQHGRAKLAGHAALKKEAPKYGIDLNKDDMESPAIKSAVGDLIAQELLALSVRSVTPSPGGDPEKPTYPLLFHSGEDLRSKLGADETAVLWEYYQMTQARFGPFEVVMTKEDVDAWVRRLVEGASENPLALLPSLQLVKLAWSLAERLYSLSQNLESHRSTLPDTLASSLKSYCLDTSSFGTPHERYTGISWENSSEALEMASRTAREKHDGESSE